MKSFLAGLAIGVPTGMLLGDHRQAVAERLRNLLSSDLRGVTNTDGSRVAEDVNRIADKSRETARRQTETSMQQKRQA